MRRYWAILPVLAAFSGCSGCADRHHITFWLSDSPRQIRDLQGVNSGPLNPHGAYERDYSLELAEIGVTSIRNNDYFDGRLDIDRIFNCTETLFGQCENSRGLGLEYPCWETCTPRANASHFLYTGSDELLASIVDGGFEPFFRLGQSMRNRQTDGAVGNDDCDPTSGTSTDGFSFVGPQTTAEEGHWIVTGQFITEHYVSMFPGIINYVDIWTESIKPFWDRDTNWSDTTFSGCVGDRPTNLSTFANFFASAITYYHQQLPTLMIGGGGFSEGEVRDQVLTGSSKGMMYRSLEAVNNVIGLPSDALDFVDIHMYEADDPHIFLALAKATRDLLWGRSGSYGSYSWDYSSVPWSFTDTEIIVGEYSADAGDYTGKECDKRFNGGLAAALHSAFWIAMQYSDVIEKAFIYRASDHTNYDSSASDCEVARGRSGLFYSKPPAEADIYKPKAHAVRLWSQLMNQYPNRFETAVPSVSALEGELWVLAGTEAYVPRSIAKTAALIANIKSIEREYRLEFFVDGYSFPQGGFSDMQVFRVDDTDTGLSPIMTGPHSGYITIEPESVHLVLLDP